LLDYPLPDEPLFIHFDTDVVNPLDSPSTYYQIPGGPREKEMMEVMRYLNRTGKVVAVSMITWNPELDTEGRSRKVCMGLLEALIK